MKILELKFIAKEYLNFQGRFDGQSVDHPASDP